MHTVDGMRVLKESYCMVMLNDRHRRHFVEMLRNTDRMKSTLAPLRTRYMFRVDCKAISLAQAIKMSYITNISTSIVRRDATFTDTMQSLLS